MKSWKQNPSEKKTQNQLENRVEKETKENQFNRAETIFLNSISHDIRTPLNVIIGYTALASAHVNEAQEVKKYLSKIEAASNHLLLLINDVLDMSHIESGTLKLEHAPVYLPDVLENLKAIIQTDSSAKQLKFCADTKNMVHKNVITDKLRLNQVLLNILENAVKYTRPGGKIYFQIQELKEQEPGFAKYEFRVKDTGIGMSEEFIAHIFEPFSREQTSTVSGIEGMGLGMAIVKKIVDRMDGTIAVKSRQGKGTEVTVILPFKVSGQPNEWEANTRKKIVQIQRFSEDKNFENLFKGKKILLTEDNELNREIAVELLKEEGFILDTAEDGTIAVEKMRTAKPGQYDLILMDIQMPIMDGYEATRQIRKLENPETANIPIVAITANAFEEDRQKALEAGMNEHVSKPIDMERLLEIMKKVLK
ncbi:ATP-binding response regulator [Blautia stercoris]|uniref:Stage 0 sporulation protein A homolog n=1 Tax=Blautia stercoris TaxID=871664 RepID=A0ABR7P8T6_9FIRM|nr:ATP-binding protein [Blautia stercoris]MBC8627794.1 response regulator [Blautia stercoris]